MILLFFLKGTAQNGPLFLGGVEKLFYFCGFLCVSTLIFFFLGVKFSGTSSIEGLWTLNGKAPYVNLVVFFMIIPTCHCVGLRSLAAKQKNTKQLSFRQKSPSKVRSLLDIIHSLLKKRGNHGVLQKMLPLSSLSLTTGTNNRQRLSGKQ